MRAAASSVVGFVAALAVVLGGCGGPGARSTSDPRAPSVASAAATATAPAAPRPTPRIHGADGQIGLERGDGTKVQLAAYGRPVTVVALWATYCRPCLDELPYVDALYREHRGDPDVAILAVNVEDRSDPAVRARIAETERALGLGLPRLYEGDALFERLAPRDAAGEPRMALPLLAVIDPGFRIHRRLGFAYGEPIADYLADKAELIEAARRGEAPAGAAPTIAAAPNVFKLEIPRMAGKALAEFGPRFRAEMRQIFPRLDEAVLDALVARAVEAARAGGELEVDLTTIVAPTTAPSPP